MDFSTAFSFFTEDDTWKRKFGIAALLAGIPSILGSIPSYFMGTNPNLVPIMGLITLLALPLFIFTSCVTSGYSIDISRNVRDGEKHPLPEWSFGSQFKQGLVIFAASLIYMIPFLILFVVAMVVIMAATIGGGTPPSVGTLAPAFVSSAVFLALLSFFMSALQVNYIRHNTFDSCFQFKSIKFIIQKRWKKLLLMMLLVGGVSLVTGGVSAALANFFPLGQLLFAGIVGLLITPILTFVYGHLYGQIASLVDLDKLNAVDPIG